MDELQINNQELEIIANKISELETKLKEYKELEKQYDNFKSKLLEVMQQKDVKKFISPDGIQFTAVSGTTEKTELQVKFNEDKFKLEHPEEYKNYSEVTEKIIKARASYLKIIMPKNEEE